ncbi:MAG: DNA/RNA nuclease SfsA [Gammaproteobacteria bacterium]
MKFEHPLLHARLIRRYKRFLADVEMDDGSTMTVHTPNTGSMLGCQDPGAEVWLLDSGNPKRKYRFGWELVRVAGGARVGVNTGRANHLVDEALRAGRLPALGPFSGLRREVRYGQERSRIDILLERANGGLCYVEVKNVTAAVSDGVALFPDAVSARGTKHLRELMYMVGQGHDAAVVFCVQREDVDEVRPADEIDPEYGETLRRAVAAGVKALALGARMDDEGLELVRELPVVMPPL